MKTIETRIEELQQIAAQAKESIAVERYDFDDSAGVKALEKHIEGVFKNRVALLRSFDRQNSKTAASDELNNECLSRRSAAVCRLAQKADAEYRDKYPQLSVARAFADLCAPCPADTFNGLDKVYHIELAAAIRILDQLRESGRLDDALEYLPESREELDRVDLPDVNDSVHSSDLIRGMLHVIRYRNCGQNGFDPSLPFMDNADASAALAGKSDSVYRSRFDGVMSLIDDDTVTQLRGRFIEAISDLTDGCLALYDQLQEKIVKLTKTKIRMIEDEIVNARQTESALNVLSDQADSGCETTVTVVGGPEPEGARAGDTRAGDIQPVYSLEEAKAVEEALQEAVFRKENFCLNILILCKERRHDMQSIIGAELSELIAPQAGDPFDTCFAFLSLLDADSDEVWGYNLPYIILADACRGLPWGDAGRDADKESEPKVTAAFYEAAKKGPEKYIVPPSESILNRRLVTRPFAGSDDDKISFAQLVYLFSGLVPPRGMPELSYIKALLNDSGLSKSEIDLLYEYFTLACSLVQRDENYVFIDEEEENADTAQDSAENDDQARELRELKRENKNLKAMLNKLEHRLKESGDALTGMSESLEEANNELAELRSMIRETDNSDKEYSTTVSFPYTAKKRAVVFGGHSSWLKAIRPLLPDIRFVEPSAQPNTGLILNADVIWIQTNALSHSDFYKIIDLVRKHGIELHYFTYASAEKCAEQFALNDMENARSDSAEE